MLICHHPSITSYFHTLFTVFTAKPICLQAFNYTYAFLSIVLIQSTIKFASSALAYCHQCDSY